MQAPRESPILLDMGTRLTKRLRRHYAGVVALLALIAAAGGTSYAAGVRFPAASVGSVQLKRGAVTASKLGAGAVTGDKVKDGSLRRAGS